MTSASGLSTVACVVITKNEETNIQDCLKSVQWADELVVVDAESRDKTVELARACGAKVSVRPWPGFGLQKNFGMAQASSDWILILDADERVTEELSWRSEDLPCRVETRRSRGLSNSQAEFFLRSLGPRGRCLSRLSSAAVSAGDRSVQRCRRA